MKVELVPAISEFIQTQINYEKILKEFINQLETDFNSTVIWVGFERESKASFISKLHSIAHGIKDLDTTPWALEWDEEGELVSVVKKTADGVEVEVTPDDAKKFVENLCNSICSGSLNHHLDVMSTLTLSQPYYEKFLNKYLNDKSGLKDQLLASFQRLTKFTLLLERISKYSNKSNQQHCKNAIEIISAKIAKTNELIAPEIEKSKKNEEHEKHRIKIKAKIIELEKTVCILSQRKSGIFRDRLKAPLQKLIVDTANLLIQELKAPNISPRYATKIQDELKILQGLAKFQGKGVDLREMALPFITYALKSIRPVQPDHPRPMPATSNTTLPRSTTANMAEVSSHQSTLDFFANASTLKTQTTNPPRPT
jgi:guanine nucleotide exchange factor for Rho/Rac/Cdc42-like GTPase family protein